MIDGLKPYAAMKDSGLPWVGEVPQHWDLVPNRALLRRRKSLVGDRHYDYQLLSLTKFGVIVRDVSTGRGKFSSDMGTSQVVRAGDLIFCLFDIPETPRTVGLSRHNGMITGAYTVFECCDSQLARFVEAFYLAMDDQKLLSPLYTGLRNTISPSTFLGTKTPLPPPAEQVALVRFLDHSDRQIQRYIHAKQKLIKLLEEQKQAIIHRAVIRGLDPTVRRKPSGVNWLGDVPEHWEIWQIGHFATVGNGSTPSRGNTAYWTGGTYPWLNSGTVNAGAIVSADQHVTERALRECHLPRVPVGSVLVAITGQGKTRGKAAVLKIEATINQHVAFITPRKSDTFVTTEYLQQFLVAAYPELRRMSDDSGSTKGALTCEDLRHFRVLLPPIAEQRRISRWVHDATAAVQSASRLAERQIALLQQYRTRLTADVVTGKLDVREAAAQLSEEADELEPVDGEGQDFDVDELEMDEVTAEEPD